ncbi:hypothetical protein TRVL_00618 [Trypanosoma vivax]|nr:hypothetical protein TRVL_00618 [Trypanosoma vivax]
MSSHNCVGFHCRAPRVRMPPAYVAAVAALGLCAVGGLVHRRRAPASPSVEDNKELLRVAAVAFSSGVVENVLLRDGELLKLLRRFVKNVATHSLLLDHLKKYAVTEFTANNETVASLRRFVVRDIVCDPWVADELINMVKEARRDIMEDRNIFPGLALQLLESAALEGLQEKVFNDALTSALQASLWKAFLGPPITHWRSECV